MPNADLPPASPTRTIVCADSLPWMREHGPLAGACAVTSLPDVSEVNIPLPDWRVWFLDAVQLVVNSVADDSAALFFQSDIKRDGRWIDKGALVTRAAEDAGAHILFHKIICRAPAGRLTPGRPGYTHLIAVSRALRCPDALPIPDVIADAVRFARDHARATSIFDPFCGVGTVPAVANALGLDSLGIEKCRKRAEQSRALTVRPDEL
ncbi:MAG: hypothetical protein KA923_03200 [Opitutaceae bacterium]|nr:hypothetical protein [Opitutaceae bacterium]